ncbi:ubiquitin carboxyl-terminal hydrolase 16 [Drosophila obscura]|uniref:ubiquitin carboxyl-terminal hydrolase 16 n=1 Tax=Drosophila obscura TaxID=7282 RepID=UPI001BB1CA6C|nr:ubiquitin carboxyl-terminal hydrolase 16 [Drosophila obscura]
MEATANGNIRKKRAKKGARAKQLLAMGKKRQMDNHDNASSTDSGQEDSHGQTAGASGSASAAGAGSLGADSPMTNCCQHIKKSVDAARLRRQLKTTGLVYECSQCQKISQSAASGSGSGVDLACDFEIDSTLWLCLKCGTQLCGRSRKQHALQHYKTPHSDSHALAMNTRSFEIWCYGCDNKVIPNSRKNLLECVELVKRLAQKPPADPPVEATVVAAPSPPIITDIELKLKSALNRLKPIVPMTGGSFEDNNSTGRSGGKALTSNLTAIPLPSPPGATASSPVPGMAKRIDSAAVGSNPNRPCSPRSELERLPRVRGLTNLGNTCFFNAVMQCLAQTPFLLRVLRELAEPGEEFELPGGTFDFKDKGPTDLPIIRGTLSSWGGLTSALANALEELQVGGGVFTPSKLFDRLCAKCPQFTGGDQHDAHELLRQLLESVRNEDLKRYQRVILQNLGYKDEDIQSVSEEMRQKCKIYGNQAGDRILRPEQVFRGFLVSTLTCQDCHSVSSRHEYFLDMSLPVAVEKPQPPQRRRPSPESSPFPIAGQTQTQTQNQSQSQSPTKINTKFTTPEDSNPFSTACSSSSSFYLHANEQEPVGPSKSQVKKEKERERKAKRAAKHHRYKQAQKLTLNLNGNGTGSQADESDAGTGRVTSSGGGDGDGQTTSDGQDPPKEDLMSSSSTTSENSDADVEDNLMDETASARDRTKPRGATGGSSSSPAQGGSNSSSSRRFFTDTNGNAQPLGEKRDDTPENMDKDSLEEDENDSGIATSPLPSGISKTTTTTTANNNEASRGAEQQQPQKDKKEEGQASADIVTAGVSEVGASTIRQISVELDLPTNGDVREEAGEANGDADANATLQLQEIAHQLAISEFTLEATAATAASATAEGVAAAAAAAGVAAAARAKRVRTYSYSDWSTTIAPRYQCEDGECSVQSCLNNFTAVELMTGQNKVGCESCTLRLNGNDTKAKSVNTNATKQLLVSSPPAVLILHLKRFQLGPRCIFRKLTRPVSYPNMLDIAAFCGSKVKNLPNIDRKQKKLLYALYGVVEHSGGMYGGHYTAYVKVRPKVTPEDNRWKFLPHGSKAELDQDDEQLKKLEELLAKEKASRLLHLNSMNDSDDFTNSSSNSSTSDEFNTNPNGGTGQDGHHEQQEEEAANVQAPPGKWYYVSDSRVQEVSEDAALKAQAYLLFYERIY